MRLLVVEDHLKLATSLKKILESKSYAVDLAYDSEEAYQKISIQEYDVVILDIGLPDGDGISLTKTLREEKNTVPILMLTARDSVSIRIAGLDSGADDYVIKPFDFGELLARIRSLLRRPTNSSSLVLSCDNLSLDPQTHVVTRAGKELHLSSREYALLEYLLRNSPHIVSKTQIIDHVWNEKLDIFSNVADVYIGYLRKKIDRDFPDQKPLLTTLKGIGYRISKN